MSQYPYNYYSAYQKDTIGILEVINFINKNMIWILIAIAIFLIVKMIFWSSLFSYIKETAQKQTDLQNDIRNLHKTILKLNGLTATEETEEVKREEKSQETNLR